jgi:hypothetical protein
MTSSFSQQLWVGVFIVAVALAMLLCSYLFTIFVPLML